MTRILLISDTHSYIGEDILKYVGQADEVWHAGDIGDIRVIDEISAIKPVKAVYGNIDNATIRAEFPEHNRFNCEDVKVWMTHIGGYPGRYNPSIRKQIESNPPDLFISGHSHILKVMPDKKNQLLHMNPGAIGKQGFHRVRTMLRFEISGRSIENLEVIEYKR
ncbi:MAG: metallophosphatase family protein [Bacteroidia bacterium]|nr:metallophosphatase family protein [Bacteroidia bacterium]MBT8268950.1 metallophosphatase family protein [Bacteroidia bacterium]NNF83229.1 metallophosphoesterase family protein [Flavobacteriaceae bacterium]NNK70071.1 metallophosphoesterase family protein [Flavobacteriaceae bacterium]